MHTSYQVFRLIMIMCLTYWNTMMLLHYSVPTMYPKLPHHVEHRTKLYIHKKNTLNDSIYKCEGAIRLNQRHMIYFL